MNDRFNRNNRPFNKPKREPRLLKLLAHRQYKRGPKGTTVRIITPPEPAILCTVRHLPSGYLTSYDPDEKVLRLTEEVTIFPSKTQAQTAIWHTAQKSGIIGEYRNYEIIPEPQ